MLGTSSSVSSIANDIILLIMLLICKENLVTVFHLKCMLDQDDSFGLTEKFFDL